MSEKPSNQNNSTLSPKSSSGSGGANSSSTETRLKNSASAIQGGIKGSFQLDEKDKKIVGDKKWIHMSLLFIPFGIFASIVILLWAFYYSGFRIETGDPQDSVPIAQEISVPDVIPLTEEEKSENEAPPIRNDDRLEILDIYFSTISENYEPEFLNDLPDEAVDLYIIYETNDDNAKKKVAAEDFFIILSQPLRDLPQDGYEEFLKDVRFDLETAIGESFFDD